MSERVEISAIVPVVKLLDKTGDLARRYIEIFEGIGKPFELVYVLDGEHAAMLEQLRGIAAEDGRLRIVQLAKNFGEATALTAGFAMSSGNTVVTLPAYAQIHVADVAKVIDELDGCDFAAGVREPHQEAVSRFKKGRRKLFHSLVRIATGQSFRDLGCGLRAFKRSVADELPIYGDQYRFFPLLATRRGFRVREVPVREAEQGLIYDRHGVKDYAARLLDILAIVFLTRFTKKPLRFFGTIGSIVFAVGGAILAYLVVQRLFFGVSLADRPALLLTSLMVVLGLQIFALGLLGELIIFTHARDIKEYTVEKIVN